ncbi:FAD:protein FMN transferase [Dermatobacter hominis]|uniref:FAD:protein FMN transferase n=1 Tax=Dermatobacter hominis TaxID=2884263 RepID=UPI001D126D0D|nr:FAD:protein FMN transferase [Dermatobacter hominis]UDY37786.1 FAD:protein FMN transferase [Dermatobacter hominis]
MGAVAEERFRVMGSDAHVAVAGADAAALLAMARARLDRLELTWSRFLPDSELSVANRSPGEWVPVSPETVELVDRSLRAQRATGGRFDPTRLGDVVAAGYRGTFGPDGPADGPSPLGAPAEAACAAAGCAAAGAAVELDRPGRRLRVRRGNGIDPGGIAKGFAADVVVEELLASGAPRACVNVGGDLRLGGRVEGDWLVDVEDPTAPLAAPICRLSIADGAVATSSRCRRRWRRPDGSEAHHLIDPSTGRPAATDVLTATVVAAEGWVAEALATAVFLAAGGPDGPEQAAAVLEGAGATGLVVTTDGVLAMPGLDRFVVGGGRVVA